MSVLHILIINRAGSLIYDYDCTLRPGDVQRTLVYPPDLKIELVDQRATVVFGERESVKAGACITALNGKPVVLGGRFTNEAGQQIGVVEYLSDSGNYPVQATFARPAFTSNEKIMLSSMFYSLYAIAAQLSPTKKSSGIRTIESDHFTLQCFQPLTGNKFVVITEPQQNVTTLDSMLRKIYEIYSDYALKNPFYSIDMPIRCELFDVTLQSLVDKFNKSGTITMSAADRTAGYRVLDKIPDQIGYQVLSPDGSVLFSSGKLQNRDTFGGLMSRMVALGSGHSLGGNVNTITIHYDDYFYTAAISAGKIYVVMRRVTRLPKVADIVVNT